MLGLAGLAAPAAKPNIAFVLTDDQDQMLGGSFPTLHGATPMPQTRSLLAEQGATAGNFFVHTPICCPSRSELLTGKYFHNLKVDPTRESKQAEDCMHINVRRRATATAATPHARDDASPNLQAARPRFQLRITLESQPLSARAIAARPRCAAARPTARLRTRR